MEACWNCRYGRTQVSRLATGELSECCCPAAEFPWHLYRRYGANKSLMPALCRHYEPELAGRCPECGAELGPPHLVEHWACGVFSVIPCCSAECCSARQKQLDEEGDAITARAERQSDAASASR